MMNVLKNNLLWIQHTPGAAGRILLICCTTSDAVGDWIDNPLPNPKLFALKHFCVSNSSDHMNNEPQTPYVTNWYTRNVIFNRGDDFTKQQVKTHLLQDPLSKKHLSENKLIANVYQKPYIPDWARDEKIITVCADDESMPWLINRRKEVFYDWKGKTVELLRYSPTGGPIYGHAKNYDPVKYIYQYTDQDKFVSWDMQKELITSGPGLNIKLSNLLNGNLEAMWDQIDDYLPLPINRAWCNILIQTWRNRWV
jgi:hypothetical protein